MISTTHGPPGDSMHRGPAPHLGYNRPMTTINTIEDLARILQEHPTWAQALRSLILSQDLMDLPEKFDQFVKEHQAFQERTGERFNALGERFDAFEGRTEERFNALQGSVDNARGPAYEMKAASNLRSLLRQHLGLRNARILKGPNREPDWEFADSLDRAQENRSITEEELAAALRLDVIAQARTADGQTVYAAVEISVTVGQGDVTRARDRARIISRATGMLAEAVVIGERTGERAAGMIEAGEARLVIYPAD